MRCSKYAAKKTKKKAKKRRKLLSGVPSGVVEEEAKEVAQAQVQAQADIAQSGKSSKRKRSQAAAAVGKAAGHAPQDECPFPANACAADVLAWVVHPISLETFFAYVVHTPAHARARPDRARIAARRPHCIGSATPDRAPALGARVERPLRGCCVFTWVCV